jgi:peptidoglycan/LPS O-acetylase OafA/YrhL
VASIARDVVLSIDGPWEINVAAILLFAILLAACSFYLMERPIQRRWRSAKVVPALSDRDVIPEPEDVVLAAAAPIPTVADPAGT